MREKKLYMCLRCPKTEFKGIRSAKHHAKIYHKKENRKDIDQFFSDWIKIIQYHL
jgi:hypothetical protein